MMNEIKDPYGFIYITTNIINGKRYIGQKKFETGSHKTRWQNYLGSGIILNNAINKYGKENFVRDIVAIAYSKDELDILEKEWITNYKAVDSMNFYNVASGGEGGNPFLGKTYEEMEEIKLKMSINHANVKKENHPLYGKHLSEESKARISESKKGTQCGEDNSMYGKIHSDKTRVKMSENRKGKGTKKIICVTTDKEFDSCNDGSDFYECDSSRISKCCKGKSKSCGKLKDGTPLEWMYYEDYINQKK